MTAHRDSERALASQASRRFGLFTRTHAESLGLDTDWLWWWSTSGRLTLVHPDVYRFAGAPAGTPEHDLMAALLQVGPTGVVSHRAAAWLHELDGFSAPVVELTVTRLVGSLPRGATVHRLANVKPIDVVTLGPWRVTAPARTLIDVCAVRPRWRAELALDDAWRRSLVSREMLAQRLAANCGKGRRGAGVMRGLLAERPETWRPLGSHFERLLVDQLVARGLPQPVTQFEVIRPDGAVALLDLAWPEHRLGVEFHGYQWHQGRSAWEAGITRDNGVVSLGWRILYATRKEVRENPAGFARNVARSLAASVT